MTITQSGHLYVARRAFLLACANGPQNESQAAYLQRLNRLWYTLPNPFNSRVNVADSLRTAYNEHIIGLTANLAVDGLLEPIKISLPRAIMYMLNRDRQQQQTNASLAQMAATAASPALQLTGNDDPIITVNAAYTDECHNCGRTGHYARDCRSPPKQRQQARSHEPAKRPQSVAIEGTFRGTFKPLPPVPNTPRGGKPPQRRVYAAEGQEELPPAVPAAFDPDSDTEDSDTAASHEDTGSTAPYT